MWCQSVRMFTNESVKLINTRERIHREYIYGALCTPFPLWKMQSRSNGIICPGTRCAKCELIIHVYAERPMSRLQRLIALASDLRSAAWQTRAMTLVHCTNARSLLTYWRAAAISYEYYMCVSLCVCGFTLHPSTNSVQLKRAQCVQLTIQ